MTYDNEQKDKRIQKIKTKKIYKTNIDVRKMRNF